MFSADNIKRLTGLSDVQVLEEIDSTNTFLKNQAFSRDEGACVIACRQTAGRGRLGRTFVSEKNGLYMSILLKPERLDASALGITAMAAVAVADTVDALTDKVSGIKWVNDVYVNGKKVSGILCESGYMGRAGYVVLGIGVNLIRPEGGMDESILQIADYLFESDTGIADEFAAGIINRFFELYRGGEYIKAYREKSILTGRTVEYERQGETHSAVVVGIDDSCALLVEDEGAVTPLTWGEVRIKSF